MAGFHGSCGDAGREIGDLVRPNGIAIAPDGRTIWVADHGANLVQAYEIRPDGSLARLDRRALLTGGPDGIAIDREGRLYATGRAGIYALSPREPGSSWVRLWGADRGGEEIYGRGQLCDRGVLFATASGLALLPHGERAPRLVARYRRSLRTDPPEVAIDAGNIRVWEDRILVASRQSLSSYVREEGEDGRTP